MREFQEQFASHIGTYPIEEYGLCLKTNLLGYVYQSAVFAVGTDKNDILSVAQMITITTTPTLANVFSV